MVAAFVIRILPLGVALSALSPTALASQGVLGAQLYESCEGSTSYDIGDCLGYIAAISDTLATGPIDGVRACAPASATTAQIRDVVVKAMREHPESLNDPAISTAVKAVAAAFPCAGKK